MTYQTQRPMIPIKLTAVAANDDMGVLVWVFGESRAVPVNYRHLVLNEAAINWFDPSSNYNDLVSLAADESGGQGFVTEAALPSDILRGQLFTNLESDQWDSIHFNGNLSDIELIYSVVYQFRFWDGLLDALAATIPLPAQTTLTEFISCIECYGYDENSDIEGFEHREFINAILELVIYPAQNTESLVTERSYMTRFYTTLSAEEMTVDPIFDFNISLSLVDNIHQSTLYVMCGEEDFDFQDAPWRAELPGGQVVSGARRGVWPYDTGEIPANQIIQQLSTTGMGEVVLDNREDIQEMTTDTRDLAAGDDDGGCSTAPTRRAPAPLSPLALLAALALLASRRGRFN
jgi:hypothetical protein